MVLGFGWVKKEQSNWLESFACWFFSYVINIICLENVSILLNVTTRTRVHLLTMNVRKSLFPNLPLILGIANFKNVASLIWWKWHIVFLSIVLNMVWLISYHDFTDHLYSYFFLFIFYLGMMTFLYWGLGIHFILWL